MMTITLQQAQTTLPDLIHRLPAGEWVIITENEKPIAQLIVPFVFARQPPRPRPPVTGIPRAGTCAGLIVVPDDFKNRLKNFASTWDESSAIGNCSNNVRMLRVLPLP